MSSQWLFPSCFLGTAEGPRCFHHWEPGAPCPETWKWEDPRLPDYLTSDGDRVQLDQWGVRTLLWSNTWDTQASAGVLVILTVVKLKGLSKVILLLRGGAEASSRTQWISWKGGGVRRAAGSLGLAKGDMAASG